MQSLIRIICLMFLISIIANFSPIFAEVGHARIDEGSTLVVGSNSSTSNDIERRTKNLIPINANCPRFMGDEEIYDKVDDFRENRATIQEGYALGFTEWLWNLFGLNTLNQLIYGNPFCIWFDTDDVPELDYGLFPTNIKTNVIEPVFNLITGAFGLFLVLAVLIAGLKMASKPITGTRFSIYEELGKYFLAGLLLFAYWLFIDSLFLMNWSIVSSLNSLLKVEGLSFGEVLMVASVDEFHFSDIIVMLAEWVLMLFLNMAYILRVFLIAVLMCLGAPVIIGLLFEKTRSIFKLWLMALVGAIFMQSVHALYFTVILLFISLNEASFILKMFLLIMFLPLSSMLLGMMQMADANIATTTTQRMVNTAAIAGRIAGKGKGMINKGKIPKGNVGKLKDTRISALAKGGSGWEKTKAGAQMAGSIAGLAAGSVIGVGGAALGAQVGGAAVNTVLQAPRNIAAGIKGIKETKKDFKDLDIKNNLSDRRTYYGSMGESIGTLFGQGSIGRSFGNIASGVSSQRLLNSNEVGGFGGVTMQDIFSKYPEASIQFQQTNEGSGFFMNQNGSMQPISPVGAADASLPDGMTRTINYRFTDSFNPANPVEHGGADLSNATPILTQTSDVSLEDVEGAKMFDASFNPRSINVDNYFVQGNPNADTRSISDKLSDLVGDYKGGNKIRE